MTFPHIGRCKHFAGALRRPGDFRASASRRFQRSRLLSKRSSRSSRSRQARQQRYTLGLCVPWLLCFLWPWTLSDLGSKAFSQEPTQVALGVWRISAGSNSATGRESLFVSLVEQMTLKQRKLVNAGFTTLSQLEIKVLPRRGADPDDFPVTISRRCTVAYDDWEETYDVTLLSRTPKATVVKSFDDYADICLIGEIVSNQHLRMLAPAGGTLWAQLVLQQTSREQAQEIKTWLVEQQSGVMQRLFSHMLGDLTLSQNVSVRVSVPPRPPDARYKRRRSSLSPKRAQPANKAGAHTIAPKRG